jgi:hypothetical protein
VVPADRQTGYPIITRRSGSPQSAAKRACNQRIRLHKAIIAPLVYRSAFEQTRVRARIFRSDAIVGRSRSMISFCVIIFWSMWPKWATAPLSWNLIGQSGACGKA